MYMFIVFLTILSLHITCITTSNASLKKFDVQKGHWNSDRSTMLYQTKAASLSVCATMCASEETCCSADYNQKSMECIRDAICPPKLEADSNYHHINISPSQDKTIVFKGKDTLLEDCDDLPPCFCDGVYTIRPKYSTPIDVYCERILPSGHRWTVVQRRIDGAVDFYRNWNEYKLGFGNVSAEYWIGNDNLHALTHSKNYTLRFDMEDFNGNTAYAEYSTFEVENEGAKYKLTIGGYFGTAGDSVGYCDNANGMPFTTVDRDNDNAVARNCAVVRKGALWYNSCSCFNPNGFYQTSGYEGADCMFWWCWKSSLESLKAMSMKIRAN